MFDDVCMLCGKFLKDAGLVYCSNTCESADHTSSSSPSLSSTDSSAFFPSPFITTTPAPQDSPPFFMLPAAKRTFDSSSSDFVSVFEYDEDEDDTSIGDEDGDGGGGGGRHEHNHVFRDSKRTLTRSAGPLFFSRQPSSADNRGPFPMIHRRDSDRRRASDRERASTRPREPSASSSTSRYGDGYPLTTGTTASAATTIHRHSRSHDMHLCVATPEPVAVPTSGAQPSSQPSSHPKRGRASLPAYFSHLALTSHVPAREHLHTAGPAAGAGAGAGTDAGADGEVHATPKRRFRPQSELFVYPAKPPPHGHHVRTHTPTNTDSWAASTSAAASCRRAVPIPGAHDTALLRSQGGLSAPRPHEVPIPRSHEILIPGSGSSRVGVGSGEGGGVQVENRGRSRVVTSRKLVGS